MSWVDFPVIDFKCPDSERFNCYSHLLGAFAALAGIAVLLLKSVPQADPWKIVSVAIYGVTLFSLFLFSSLYHCTYEPSRSRYRRLDHYTIYLLIAGTYTPFTLVTMNGTAEGWLLFGEVWLLALVGMTHEALSDAHRRRILPVVIYLMMGWLVLGSLKSLLAVLPEQGYFWLLAGGICYTSGVFFFALGRYHQWAHGVWHVLVLGGGYCHYWAVVNYVL